MPSPKAAILSGRADERTDYSKLIDAETWAFIERTNSFYPADAVERSVGGQRHTCDSMCRAFHAGHPQGVTATDTAIGTPTHRIPIRIYRNARPDDIEQREFDPDKAACPARARRWLLGRGVECRAVLGVLISAES
ncbi:hypothetical protein [Aquamicrobium defluvii]|uniref:hypothetical protein n=1 Tax=Aquamicrobium defluvii TaxID=69279 RepID=UPI0004538EAB|nr:hypothetical protein CF98_10600 [Halopseudomonas bauzanensis]